MELHLEKYNVRDATLRSLLALANEFGVRYPDRSQQEKLQEISDALEARVQDEIDDAIKSNAPDVEDDPDIPVDWADIVLMEDGQVINFKGVLYQKACNVQVADLGWDVEPNKGHRITYCIKQFNHKGLDHEDLEGNVRP